MVCNDVLLFLMRTVNLLKRTHTHSHHCFCIVWHSVYACISVLLISFLHIFLLCLLSLFWFDTVILCLLSCFVFSLEIYKCIKFSNIHKYERSYTYLFRYPLDACTLQCYASVLWNICITSIWMYMIYLSKLNVHFLSYRIYCVFMSRTDITTNNKP